MSAERESYDDLVARVSDGGAVDWEQARTASGDPRERERVETLHELARIAEFSRGLQRGAPAPEPAGEPLRWGTLLLLERIGRGTSGEVWRAWDPQLQRELAVKLLRTDDGAPAGAAPLLAEGQALARVRHPNVVTVHGLEEHDGRVGLRMELVRGTTLERELERRGALAVDEVARLAADLFGALAAVHAAGVLHRDVKPANVVRDDDGRWVLADFGLGLRRGLARDGVPRSSGTPMFMPPEALDGAPPDERADVYAAGATLMWAMTGKPPYEARSFDELRAAARRGPDAAALERRADVPAPLVAAILRALAPQPPVPPLRAAELAASLAAREPVAGNRGRGMALALAMVIVAAVAAGLYAARHREPATAVTPGVTPAPAASVPPADASSYAIEATLVRHEKDGDRALASGDPVRPGDRLSLDVHATRPVWMYVLDGDERGETYLLFPQPLYDRGNPVRADSAVRLPGRIGGRESAWTVTSRGGREHILIVASPEPVAELESALASLPAPRPDRPVSYARVEAPQLERLRGVGGVAPLPAGARTGPAPMFERFRSLAGRESDVRGTWVRQVTLENPLR